LDYLSAVVDLEIVAGPTTPGYLFQSLGGVRGTGKWVWKNKASQTCLKF
jgi:hypothetical protein